MKRITNILLFSACFFSASLFSAPLSAHPLAPSLLELHQVDAGTFSVRWKTPRVQPTGVSMKPVLPTSCQSLTTTTTEVEETALIGRWSIDCGSSGLHGLEVRVDGLAESGTSALLQIHFAGDRNVRAVLRGDAPTFQVPEEEQPQHFLRVAWDYLALGLVHILTGADHLLFVLGLLLLVVGRRALITTITAFTLGHSVTLSLASLGLVDLPSAPIEAVIALSILFLAVELTHPSSRSTFLRRCPWGIAAAFGLLHGLGFAGALAEVGLPNGEIQLALLSFNIGIETGQLLFIAVLIGLKKAADHLAAPSWALSPPALAYVIGPLAAFWCYERTASAILAGG